MNTPHTNNLLRLAQRDTDGHARALSAAVEALRAIREGYPTPSRRASSALDSVERMLAERDERIHTGALAVSAPEAERVAGIADYNADHHCSTCGSNDIEGSVEEGHCLACGNKWPEDGP